MDNTIDRELSRADLEARYSMFQEAVLIDQRRYYRKTVEIYEKASKGVRFWRALMALIAGLASTFVSLIILNASSNGTMEMCNVARLEPFLQQNIELPTSVANPSEEVDCTAVNMYAPILIVIATVAPAIAAAFATLSDLYQWDRQSSIYKNAQRNLALPEALSPDDEMDDEVYRRSLEAYAEGALRVMRDETSQWGQSVKIPDALQKYIEKANGNQEKK